MKTFVFLISILLAFSALSAEKVATPGVTTTECTQGFGCQGCSTGGEDTCKTNEFCKTCCKEVCKD